MYKDVHVVLKLFWVCYRVQFVFVGQTCHNLGKYSDSGKGTDQLACLRKGVHSSIFDKKSLLPRILFSFVSLSIWGTF